MPFGLATSVITTGVGMGLQASAANKASKEARMAAMMQMKNINEWYKSARHRAMPYQKFGKEQLPIYQQALQDYSNALPGYWDQTAKYQQAVDAYKGVIPGVEQAMAQYQTVVPEYRQAMQDYKGALGRMEGMVGGLGATAEEMGQLSKRYQDAMKQYYAQTGRYTENIPEMTRQFTQADYEKSPVYTPMVRNLAELEATPGYQFELQQGQKQLAQSAAARGGMLSGAQQQAANRFGQQQAATGFQNAWQRAQTAYQTALGQHQAYQQNLSDVLGQNVGLYGQGATLTGQEQPIISGKANIQAQQIDAMGNVLGGYNTAVGQVAGLGDIYNTGYNQQLGRAGLYGNVADMARGGAGLYAAGMELINQNVANRRNAVDFGYNANMDLTKLGLQRTSDLNAAIGGYGNAGAANAIAQGNILANGIGQIGGAIGGGLAGYFGGGASGNSNNTGALFGSMFGNPNFGTTTGTTKPMVLK